MHASSPRAFRCAAVLGLLTVLLGAVGAHALETVLAALPKAQQWWDKAVFYQAAHVPVLLLAACLRPFPAVAWVLLAAGVVLFSGSLYLLALGGPYALVYVTPFGGLFLLAGWLWLAVRPLAVPVDEKGGPL